MGKKKNGWVVALFGLIICAGALSLGYFFGNWVLADLFNYSPTPTISYSDGSNDHSDEDIAGIGDVDPQQNASAVNHNNRGTNSQSPQNPPLTAGQSPSQSPSPTSSNSTSTGANTNTGTSTTLTADVLYWYKVQVGHYSEREIAETLLVELIESGYTDAFIVSVSKGYRVQVGSFSTNSGAEQVANKLRNEGREVFVVQVPR